MGTSWRCCRRSPAGDVSHVTHEPIHVDALIASVSDPGLGGTAIFIGSVRRGHEDGPMIEDSVPHRAMADTLLTLESFRYFVGRLAPRDPTEPAVTPEGRSDD